jgi:hypothetical protein
MEAKHIRELSPLLWFTNLGITNPTPHKNNLDLRLGRTKEEVRKFYSKLFFSLLSCRPKPLLCRCRLCGNPESRIAERNLPCPLHFHPMFFVLHDCSLEFPAPPLRCPTVDPQLLMPLPHFSPYHRISSHPSTSSKTIPAPLRPLEHPLWGTDIHRVH